MREVVTSLVRNRVLANVLLFILIFVGIVATQSMVREFFPKISSDVILVEVVFPGADPEEVEEGISRKVEEVIDGLEGIKEYNTVSMEGKSRTVVEVADGYDVDDVESRVRSVVDGISTFPRDAEQPIISEFRFHGEVIFLALWGDQSERQLKEWAEQIKDELQRFPEISQVTISGTRPYEIAIEVSEERLREYGLSFAQVSDAVRRGSLNLSGGTIRTKGEEIRIRAVGRKYTGGELASIVVLARPNGEIITLDRIATITDGFAEDPIKATFNGRPCVMLGVYKTDEEDAIAIADLVRRFVAEKEPTLPKGLHVSIWSDQSKLIQARINVLVRNGIIGLTIVFCSLWLFLDLRLSFWVGMGIPISLSGALAIMWALGSTINMVSLFALILVLGIIVDDAIVVGEAIYVHRKRGDPPLRAAVNGVFEVGLPVIAAVTTTIVAFLPLYYVSGIMGKFIAIVPLVVIAALTTSLVECLFLLPAHLNHLPDMNSELSGASSLRLTARRVRKSIADGLEWFVEHVYGPLVGTAVHWRYISLAAAVSIVFVTVGLLQSGFIKFIMFPPVDGNDIVATVEFPRGTPIETTSEALDRTREAIERVAARTETVSGKPLIKHVFSVAGEGGDETARIVGSHVGEVRVELLPTEERGIHYQDLNVAWEKEVGAIPGTLSQTFGGMAPGPPGAAIEIWLQGEDMDMLLAVSEKLKAKLSTYDGVYQVADDFRPGKNELRVDLKPEARALGLTLEDLARQVYAGYYGDEALRFQRGRDDVRVKVRYTEDERAALARLDSVRIRTPQGHEVPFFSVADVRYGAGYSSITRTNGLRRVSVTAEIDTKRANSEEVLADIARVFMPGIMGEYPDLVWKFEGAKQDSREALSSLKIGFPIALFGIFVIIATIFGSYLQPLIIMVTVPFGIIGAIWGHLLMGFDVTMLSMFGLVALAGVVVNDAIILIECINNLVASGVPFFEALRRGGMRRFRAIILTTISTCGGLTPLILEKDMQAQFLIPMALALAAGVAFATVLTLILEPCLLAILNDFRRVGYKFLYGRWPAPEEVEPSRLRRFDPLEEDVTTPEPVGVTK